MAGVCVCVCVCMCVCLGGILEVAHREVMKPGWLATCLLVSECRIQHALMTH